MNTISASEAHIHTRSCATPITNSGSATSSRSSSHIVRPGTFCNHQGHGLAGRAPGSRFPCACALPDPYRHPETTRACFLILTPHLLVLHPVDGHQLRFFGHVPQKVISQGAECLYKPQLQCGDARCTSGSLQAPADSRVFAAPLHACQGIVCSCSSISCSGSSEHVKLWRPSRCTIRRQRAQGFDDEELWVDRVPVCKSDGVCSTMVLG